MSVASVNVNADPALAMLDAKTFLDGVSGRLRAQLPDGTACTIGTSRKVHAVVLTPWLGGVLLPVPACRVGVSGWRLDRMQVADLTNPGIELCARPACKALHETAHRAVPLSGAAARRAEPPAAWIQDPLPFIGVSA